MQEILESIQTRREIKAESFVGLIFVAYLEPRMVVAGPWTCKSARWRRCSA